MLVEFGVGTELKEVKKRQNNLLLSSSNFFSCDFFCGFCYPKQIWYNFGSIFANQKFLLPKRHWNACFCVFSSITILLIMETNRRFWCSVVVYMYAMKHQRYRNCVFIPATHFIFKSEPFPFLHKLLSKLIILNSWWLN